MTAKKKNNFLVQGSVLAVASIVGRIIGLMYRIPMTNNIGTGGMGYYNVAFEVYNVALILSSYSLPLAVSKLVAARTVKKEHKNAYRIFICSLAFALLAGSLAALIVYFSADFLAVHLYSMTGAALPLKVLSPAIFIMAVMGVLRGFFQGKNTMLPTAFSQVLEQIVNAVVSVAASYYFMKQHSASAAITSYGAAGGTLGTALGALSAFCFLLFIYVLYAPTFRRQRNRDRSGGRESYRSILFLIFATMIPVILSQTVYQLSGNIDSILFNNIMAKKGFAEDIYASILGSYSTQYKTLTNVPIAIASAYAVSMIPSITSAKAIKDMKGIKQKVNAAIKLNMIIAIPAAVGMGVLAEPIVKMLFPSTDILGAQLMQMGSIAIVFYALSTISNAVLQGINKLKLPMIHSAISLALHTVLIYVMLDMDFGIYALVIGNITFPLVICILNWISIAKELRYRQEVFKTFVVPTFSAAIMGLATFGIYKGLHILTHSNSISTMAAILGAVIVYAVFLLLFKGLSEDEIYSLPKGAAILKVLRRLHLV